MIHFIVFSCLCVSTFTDILKREIPILLWAVVTPISLFTLFIGKELRYSNFIFAVILFLLFYIQAKFFSGGGGDVIMMTCLGAILGMEAIYITLIASAGVLLYGTGQIIFKNKIKAKSIPLAPFVLLGFVICRMIGG